MSSLTIELYAEILQYLSGIHLKECSLVCSEFLHIARQGLTWHFNLFHAGKGDKFKRDFALQKTRNEVYLNARRLNVMDGGLDPDLSQWFPNLRHISLLWPLRNTQPLWSMEPFSRMYSLSLAGIRGVPLRKLFAIFPSLKWLKLKDVEFDNSAPLASYEDAPELSYLAIDNLDVINGTAPLARYLKYKSKSIRSFRLGCPWHYNRPPPNYIVPSLKPFLQHVFINVDFYEYITLDSSQSSNASFCVPLAELPQIQSLNFEIKCPEPTERWSRWLSWVILQLQHNAPACLRKIQFRSRIQMIYVENIREDSHVPFQDHEVNLLAKSSPVILAFLLRTPWTGDIKGNPKWTVWYDREAGVVELKKGV
ncbi:hypothetical protein DL96DRAFT_1816746, partial [Flagelloscypha sp. PMI_526]